MSDLLFTCLRFSGPDRAAFLQGQLTQNVEALPAAVSLVAAWCNPKGRVIVSGRLLDLGESIGWAIPTASVEPVTRRLTLYRLRAKVEFDADPDVVIVAYQDAGALASLESAGALPGPGYLEVVRENGLTAVRLGEQCVEVFAQRSDLAAAGLSDAKALQPTEWRQARIRAGLVDIDVDTAERFTPHMLNFDRVGALSFDKGCYTGQEVVARTEHLGKVKRRVCRYRLDRAGAMAGARLRSGDSDIGEVVNVSENDALAVVPVQNCSETLHSDFGPAVPQPLPYPID